jgi:hypothetical protein
MGGLLSKESECAKECKEKCPKPSNDNNKTGIGEKIKETLEEAKNAVKDKLGGTSSTNSGNSPAAAPGQPAPGQPAPGQPAPGQPAPGQPAPDQPPGNNSFAGGGRKSKRKRSRRRKLKRFKKAKRSRKNNKK